MKSKLNKTFLALLTFGALGLAASGAQAGWDHPGYGPVHAAHVHKQSEFFKQHINARQDRQMERIHAGMRQGDLTRFEFHRLLNEQQEIRAMERHFRADGFIDAGEFRRLDHALDVASSHIKVERHDRQDRYAYSRSPWHN